VGLGDRVTVQLTCNFTVATPLIANILGGTIEVTAESNFPVKAGVTAVLPPDGEGGGTGSGGGGVSAPPTAAFLANNSVFSTDATPVLTVLGPTVVVDFRDASGGGPPSTWSWDFGDGVTSTAQDVAHEYTCTTPDAFGYCSHLVEMTSGNVYGTSAATYMTILVRAESNANFTADRQVIDRGQSITFTDASTEGGTNFAWTFGDGGTATGPAESVSHTYATAGTYTVTLTVTYPSPIPEETVTKTAFITVNPGYCTVPILKNVRFNDALAVWRGAPYNFTGTVSRATGASNGNFKIQSQSIAGGSGALALCTSSVNVSDHMIPGTP
jgi:PKD repeat protein